MGQQPRSLESISKGPSQNGAHVTSFGVSIPVDQGAAVGDAEQAYRPTHPMYHAPCAVGSSCGQPRGYSPVLAATPHPHHPGSAPSGLRFMLRRSDSLPRSSRPERERSRSPMCRRQSWWVPQSQSSMNSSCASARLTVAPVASRRQASSTTTPAAARRRPPTSATITHMRMPNGNRSNLRVARGVSVRSRPLRCVAGSQQASMATNKQWILKKRPEGEIKAGDLDLVDTPMPTCGEGQVRTPVRACYVAMPRRHHMASVWMPSTWRHPRLQRCGRLAASITPSP